jgi:hypothetical protein
MLQWKTKTTTNKGRQNSVQKLTQSPLKHRRHRCSGKGLSAKFTINPWLRLALFVPVCKMGFFSRVLPVIFHTSGV